MHLLKSGRNTLQPQIHFNTATACTKGTDLGRTSLVNGPPQGEITRVKYITTSLISRFPNTVELLVRGDLIFLELEGLPPQKPFTSSRKYEIQHLITK